MMLRSSLRLPPALLLVAACGSGRDDDGDGTATGASQASISISGPTVASSAPDDTTVDGSAASTDAAVTTGAPGSTADPTGGAKFDLGDGMGDSDTTAGADELCPCAPKLDLIYVLSDDRELWTYDPSSNAFTMIGPLGCPTSDGTFSMGVGRDGKAWVQTTYLNDEVTQSYIGDLFILDVLDPSHCTDPGYTPGAGGWQHFGMGFVSNSLSDPCDKLYGQHWNGAAGGFTEGPNVGLLGVFDPVALTVQTIGATDYNGAELTGTGDGRLYAFAGAPSAKLIEFDKTDAQVLATVPFADFPLTSAFAFAFWGGDFYFFTEGNVPYSKVTKLDHDGSDGGGQQLTVVNPMAPIRIVGAGVSTCAPVLPPD